MRKLFLGLMTSILILLTPLAFAAVAVNENGTYQGEAVTLDFPSAWVDSFDGSTATLGGKGIIRFNLSDLFVTDSDGSVIGPVTASTTPGIETDNNRTSLVWADGEVSYVQVTFIVPADYASSGVFRVVADQSNSLSKCEIDFEVYVNTLTSNSYAWNTTHTDETPVALTLTASGSPETVLLTPTPTISADKLVTFNMWRSNRDTGANANATADLEVYYLDFYYSRN